MRVGHDHARALGAALPDPAELCPAPPPSASAEALRLSPLAGAVPAAEIPWQGPATLDRRHPPLVAALHRRLTEERTHAPGEAALAALAMTRLLTELDALAARVRTEQGRWLRA
jgi:hypothetical protein